MRFRLQRCQQIIGFDVGFILGLFGRREFAFIGLFRQNRELLSQGGVAP